MEIGLSSEDVMLNMKLHPSFAIREKKAALLCEILGIDEENNPRIQWLMSLLEKTYEKDPTPVDFRQQMSSLEGLTNGITKELKNDLKAFSKEGLESHSVTIHPNLLPLFLGHTVPKENHQGNGEMVTPIPQQADVNGKRFTPPLNLKETIQGDRRQVLGCERRFQFLVVPYKAQDDSQSEDGTGCRDRCKVLPMKLRDTLEEGKRHDSLACGLETEDFVTIFERLFSYHDFRNVAGKKRAGILMVHLLRIVQENFNLQESDGWTKLIASIAKNVWKDKACERLNYLGITKKNFIQFTIVLFGSIVPVKLGYLMGESVALAIYEATMKRQYLLYAPDCSLDILVVKDGTLPHVLLKCISNKVIEQKMSRLLVASLADYILEMAVEAMQREPDEEMELKDKAIFEKKSRDRQSWALDLLLEARKHHNDIRQILSEYEQSQKDDGFRLDDKDGKAFFLNKAGKKIYNPKSDNKAPKVLFFVIGLLTEFHSAGASRALVKLLSTDKGKSLLPSGSVQKPVFGPYVNMWDVIYSCLKEMAKAHWEHGQQLIKSKVNADLHYDKKITMSVLGSTLARDLFPVVAEYGLRVEQPKSWEKNYDHLFSRLQTKEEDDPNLQSLISILYKTVLDGAEDSPVKFDQCDNSKIVFGFKMYNKERNYESVSLLDLVTGLLNDENDGLAKMMQYWLKSEIQRKKTEKAEQKSKKNNKDQKTAPKKPPSQSLIDTDESDNDEKASLQNRKFKKPRLSKEASKHWKKKYIADEAGCNDGSSDEEEDDEVNSFIASESESQNQEKNVSFHSVWQANIEDTMILEKAKNLGEEDATALKRLLQWKQGETALENVLLGEQSTVVVKHLMDKVCQLAAMYYQKSEKTAKSYRYFLGKVHKYKSLVLKCPSCSQQVSSSSAGSTHTHSPVPREKKEGSVTPSPGTEEIFQKKRRRGSESGDKRKKKKI